MAQTSASTRSSECDVEKMETGYEVSKDEIDDIRNIFKIRSQCLSYGGKFVKLVLPEGFNVEAFAPSKTFKEGEELPPGIYTYFFYTSSNVLCVPVKNKFEIGTNHYTLASLSKAERVFAAGELERKNGTLTFNLLSGTFMRPWMGRILERKCDSELTDKTLRMLQTAFPQYTVVSTNEGLIRDDTVPISKSELDRYVKMGIEVRMYADKETCSAYPETIETQRDVLVNTYKRFPPRNKREQQELDQKMADFDAELSRLNQYEVYRSGGKRWKMPRKYTRRYCKKTSCKRMGFTQRSSCRPYKNCFKL